MYQSKLGFRKILSSINREFNYYSTDQVRFFLQLPEPIKYKLNSVKNLIYILLFLMVTFISTATFSQGNDAAQNLNVNQNIKVIELRNYLVRQGRRDEFIKLFEDNFVQSQNILGGYILGQYRVKGADDNFFWVRGFRDMPARYKFLNDFYFGSPDRKQHKSEANSMLLNNDNVYLLKPLNLKDGSNDAESSFNTKLVRAGERHRCS